MHPPMRMPTRMRRRASSWTRRRGCSRGCLPAAECTRARRPWPSRMSRRSAPCGREWPRICGGRGKDNEKTKRLTLRTTRDISRCKHQEADALVNARRQQVLIVRDGHHAALKLIDGHDQRVDRLEVQVVGRLVQNQQVRPRKSDDGERDARFLPTRQCGDLLKRQVARDAKAAEVATQLLRRCRGKERHHELERRLLEIQLVHVVLREARDARIAAELDPAVDGRQLAHDELDQCRLADAVAGGSIQSMLERVVYGHERLRMSTRYDPEQATIRIQVETIGFSCNAKHTLRPRQCANECRRAGRWPRAECAPVGIQT